MKQDQFDYLHRRELEERTAAEKAACDAARRAHQELADEYAERARRLNSFESTRIP